MKVCKKPLMTFDPTSSNKKQQKKGYFEKTLLFNNKTRLLRLSVRYLSSRIRTPQNNSLLSTDLTSPQLPLLIATSALKYYLHVFLLSIRNDE